MLRLQDNVPQNYIQESRDFQLFCRLYDCVNNGVKFDIDSMIYLFDPLAVNNRMLTLLANRLGFFPKHKLNDMMLRYMISAFPYLVKYKGTKRGIEGAVGVVLRADNIFANYSVQVNNSKGYIIEISIDKDYDRTALKELLDYICPIGYIVKLHIANSYTFTTNIDLVDVIYSYIDTSATVSQVIRPEDDWALPTYSIEESSITEDQMEIGDGKPKRSATTVEEIEGKEYYVTSYTYYEGNAQDGYKKKVMTIKVPDNSNNRYIGTIGRTEVIGSSNDISDYESQSDRNPVDDLSNRDYHYSIIPQPIIDKGVSSSKTKAFYLKESVEKVFPKSGNININLSDVQLQPGDSIDVGDWIIDKNSSIGEVTNIEGVIITLNIIKYVEPLVKE